MTVKELREILATFPDDMPVAYRLHSEHMAMDAEDIQQHELLPKGGYLSHPYSEEEKLRTKPHLVFPGN